MISGARYRKDPAILVVKPRWLIILERPKSDNKGVPSSATKMFAYKAYHENRSNEWQTHSHPWCRRVSRYWYGDTLWLLLHQGSNQKVSTRRGEQRDTWYQMQTARLWMSLKVAGYIALRTIWRYESKKWTHIVNYAKKLLYIRMF